MTDTIAFISDTHLGGLEPGFQQQPRRADLLPDICKELKKRLDEHGVDLLVHGGDHADRASIERIDAALRTLKVFDCPVAACLGNHDQAFPEAYDTWQEKGSALPNVTWADGVASLKHVDVFVLNTAWINQGQAGRYWNPDGGECLEAVLEETLSWLDAELSKAPDRPAMLAMHAPLDPVPARLTGAEPLHAPQPEYETAFADLLDRHPRVRAVFTGHNHCAAVFRLGKRVHVNTSSIIEPPFEYRLVRFEEDSLDITTHAAMDAPKGVEYLDYKSWVNGQVYDRDVRAKW